MVVAPCLAIIVLLLSVIYINSAEEKNTVENAATQTVQNKKDEPEFFSGFQKDTWYYDDVCSLISDGVITNSENFDGNKVSARRDIVELLYNLGKVLKIKDKSKKEMPFTDISKDDKSYDAILWAYGNSIVSGYSDNTFSPDDECTKEQMCVIMVRFLRYADAKVPVVGNTEPFPDSLNISEYARSSVVSLKLAGVVGGNDKGLLKPADVVTNGELAAIVNRVMKACKSKPSNDAEIVNLEEGAYLYCYDEYSTYMTKYHEPYVELSENVDLSYFDDAVFVGDSVSMSLQYYCASTKALGKARFLCAGSLSPVNAARPITEDSIHPIYNGSKVHVEDAIAMMGVKKVYIMLGINSLEPFDNCVLSMKNFVSRILKKSPGVTIILQSVTPMTKDSPITRATLNNDVINRYNEELYKMAKENGWYYVNVSEVMADEYGYLKEEYCSDPDTMGIHFNYKADKVWADYLISHAPHIR